MIKSNTLKTISTFSRNIHIMVGSEGICALATGMFFFLQILYYDFIGISPATIGIIFSIGSLFTLVGFFIGPFIKNFGRKNLMCIGIIILAFGIGFHIIFSRLVMIIIGQILISIGSCFVQVTELQLLYSYTTGQKECCAYSYKYSTNLIGGSIGALIGGNINRISYFNNIGYRKLFLVAIIMLLIVFAVRYFLLPKDSRVNVEKYEAKKIMKNSITIIKIHKNIQLFAILLFIATIGFSGVGPYNNLILKTSFNLGNNIISYITFILTISSMIGLVLMPSIIDKIGVSRFNVIIFIAAIMSCFTLTMSLTANVFIFFLISRCIFALLIVSSLDSLMMSNIGKEYRDIFAAVKMLVSGIAVSLGNFIGGFILNIFGYKGNYLYGGIMLICGVLFFYVKVRGHMLNKKVNKVCSCHFKSRQIEYERE